MAPTSSLGDTMASLSWAYQQSGSLIRDAIVYLQVPSRAEYWRSLQSTGQDWYRALGSLSHLLLLTFRPLVILGAFLTRWLWVVLQVVAQHTVQHGWVAARKGVEQVVYGAQHLWRFQQSLSRTAVACEVGAVALVGVLFLIRRHLRHKRYFARLALWYRRKKYAVKRKYDSVLRSISETSVFLANLLPHGLYLVFVGVTYYMAPWLIRYLASHTYLTDIISLWLPLVQTLRLVFQWRRAQHLGLVKKQAAEAELAAQKERQAQAFALKRSAYATTSSSSSPAKRTSLTDLKKSKVDAAGKRNMLSERYLSAVQSNTPEKKALSSSLSTYKSAASKEEEKDNWKNKSALGDKDEATTTTTTSPVLDDDGLQQEMLFCLQYWIVYALLCALFALLSALPIVGTVLTPLSEKAAAAAPRRMGWFGPSREAPTLLSKFIPPLRLSGPIRDQVLLLFFVWLRYLPTSLTTTTTTVTETSPSTTTRSNISTPSSVTRFSKGSTAANLTKNDKSTGVRAMTAAWEKKQPVGGGTSSPTTRRWSLQHNNATSNTLSNPNTPLQILYVRLVPMATQALHRSTVAVNQLQAPSSLTAEGAENKETEGGGGGRGLLQQVGQYGVSFLNLAVMMQMISASTKATIITTVQECAALAPASITLLMPGYFTKLGCHYVNKVVPAANSAMALEALVQWRRQTTTTATSYDKYYTSLQVTTVVRYLQYWVLYAVLSFVVAVWIAPLLAWVPLVSHHLLWIFWAHVQLQSTTLSWFHGLERELVAFGFFHFCATADAPHHNDDDAAKSLDIYDTVSFSVARRILQSLPSSSSSSSETPPKDTSSRVVAVTDSATTKKAAFADTTDNATRTKQPVTMPESNKLSTRAENHKDLTTKKKNDMADTVAEMEEEGKTTTLMATDDTVQMASTTAPPNSDKLETTSFKTNGMSQNAVTETMEKKKLEPEQEEEVFDTSIATRKKEVPYTAEGDAAPPLMAEGGAAPLVTEKRDAPERDE